MTDEHKVRLTGLQIAVALIAVVGVAFVGLCVVDVAYHFQEHECNACLERNEISCEYGNCTEYAQDVEDCCPMCWVQAEGTVQD